MKPARLPVNSIPPPTSVATHYGSSSATDTHTRPAATSAWRPLKTVPNVNWARTTATARRRLALSSLKAPGIRCQLTGREPMLPPDLTSDASPSPAAENPAEYVETIRQQLQLTHQQMAAPPPASTTNPYQIGSLIFTLTTPPERTSKLAPRWKGPYRVCRIPNEYQVVYEDSEVERTIHVNHAKPAKFIAPEFPKPVPPIEEPRPPLGYLPAGFTYKPSKPRAPPVNRNEAAMPPRQFQQYQPRHLPPPLQPIKIQSPPHLAGDLPGSILS